MRMNLKESSRVLFSALFNFQDTYYSVFRSVLSSDSFLIISQRKAFVNTFFLIFLKFFIPVNFQSKRSPGIILAAFILTIYSFYCIKKRAGDQLSSSSFSSVSSTTALILDTQLSSMTITVNSMFS